MPNRYHNALMHETGRHDKRLPAGECRHCDDAEAADRLRAIYDHTGQQFGERRNTMTQQATPGPWHIYEYKDDYDHFWSIAPRNKHLAGSRIAQVLETTDDTGEANASLIAAAPDLLAALETALPYLEHPDVQAMPFVLPAGPIAERARAAIASAKGETL